MPNEAAAAKATEDTAAPASEAAPAGSAPDDAGNAAAAAKADGPAGGSDGGNAPAPAKDADGTPAPAGDALAPDVAATADKAVVDAAKAAADAAAVVWPEKGFPDNWRERQVSMLPADQQEKALKALKAFASPADHVRSTLSAASKINEVTERAKGLVKIPTGKDDKPEDIAAFEKAMGIPDDAAKYEIKLPDGAVVDAAFVDMAKPVFKGLRLSQAQVDGVVALQTAINAEAAREAATSAAQYKQASEDDLRVHFGVKAFGPTVEVINRYWQEEIAPKFGSREEGSAMLSKPFADGTTLGNNPGFIKAMAALALPWADDGGIIIGDGGSGADLQAEHDKIMGWMHSDPKRYAQPETEKRLLEVISGLERQKGRKVA